MNSSIPWPCIRLKSWTYKLGLKPHTNSSSQIVQGWFYSFQREQSINLLFSWRVYSFILHFCLALLVFICYVVRVILGIELQQKWNLILFWREGIHCLIGEMYKQIMMAAWLGPIGIWKKRPHSAGICVSFWKMTILPGGDCMIGIIFIPGRGNVLRLPPSLSI